MIDLKKLNSATKYPSILTYHEMGSGGRLNPKIQVPFVQGQEIYVTEKVDGTNARIVMLPDSAPIIHHGPRHWVIGSREELLAAQNDLVYQETYGIVDALRPIAEVLPCHAEDINVYFFEVFGGDLPASKQYTDSKSISLRLFDQARVPMSILDMPIEKIAAWRDHGGQEFKSEEARAELLNRLENGEGLALATVPPLAKMNYLPETIEATYEWLQLFSASKCNLGGGRGRAEGIVARTADRKLIAKLRFEDYERTLGVKRK